MRAGIRSTAEPHLLTRFVLLRWLGLVYFVAFLSLARQLPGLLGASGLTPVRDFLPRASAHFGSDAVAWFKLPSLFWLNSSDAFMLALAYLGCALSFALLLGYANSVSLGILWVLYVSFVHVGQLWYSFGWEILLCEVGALAVFLAPVWNARPFTTDPVPTPVIWLFRWLALRVMLGAGLIKLRGDPCWFELSCLDVHFETQPLPGPLSAWFHVAPGWTHQAGVVFNHLAELVAPLFVFGPRRLRLVAAAVMLAFQLLLIISGNLSFLNWLSVVPLLACLDDRACSKLLPRALRERFSGPRPALGNRRQQVAQGLLLVTAALSIFPVVNMLSARQAMNRSYNPLFYVNTYGAFGSVTASRTELVIEGTDDNELTADTRWQAYEFPCKPGDVTRRPCWATPYHYRLDWLMWFAAMSTPESHPWTRTLLDKILADEKDVLRLFAVNPFAAAPPRWVRIQQYRYVLLAPGQGAYWQRQPLGTWHSPMHNPQKR